MQSEHVESAVQAQHKRRQRSSIVVPSPYERIDPLHDGGRSCDALPALLVRPLRSYAACATLLVITLRCYCAFKQRWLPYACLIQVSNYPVLTALIATTQQYHGHHYAHPWLYYALRRFVNILSDHGERRSQWDGGGGGVKHIVRLKLCLFLHHRLKRAQGQGPAEQLSTLYA